MFGAVGGEQKESGGIAGIEGEGSSVGIRTKDEYMYN